MVAHQLRGLDTDLDRLLDLAGDSSFVFWPPKGAFFSAEQNARLAGCSGDESTRGMCATVT